MASILDNLKYQYKAGGMYIRLIFINVIVFAVFGILTGISILMKWDNLVITLMGHHYFIPESWFSFSSNPSIFLHHPWSIITYMFMHGNLMHLLMNMLIFFFMGKLFEQYLGKKKLLNTYILGGIFGAVLFMVAHNVFPLLREQGHLPMVGASASVMAILAGIATYAPNIEVLVFGVFRLKLFVIAIIYGALDMLSLGAQDGVAHFAHLGGALWGFLYISQVKKGKDWATWFDDLVASIGRLFNKKPKMKVEYNRYKQKGNTKKQPPRDDLDYNAQKINKQARLDAILDKIKEGGYECLSTEEKNFLANF